MSKVGAKANATGLSLAETTKANGIDVYQYLVKRFTDLPNLPIDQRPNLFEDYMPSFKNIQATCTKSPFSSKTQGKWRFVIRTEKRGIFIFRA